MCGKVIMMFIVFWEYEPIHADVVFRKLKIIQEEKKGDPKKFPLIHSGPYHFSGEFKGIIICEIDYDERQIFNLHSYLQPEVLLNFVPLLDLESVKGMIKWN